MEIERGRERESMWTKVCEAYEKTEAEVAAQTHVCGTVLSLFFARRFELAHLHDEVEHAR